MAGGRVGTGTGPERRCRRVFVVGQLFAAFLDAPSVDHYDFSNVPSEIIAPYVSLIRLIVRPFPSLTSIFDFLTRS